MTRLLPQAGGFEGLPPASVLLDPYEPALTQPVSPSLLHLKVYTSLTAKLDAHYGHDNIIALDQLDDLRVGPRPRLTECRNGVNEAAMAAEDLRSADIAPGFERNLGVIELKWARLAGVVEVVDDAPHHFDVLLRHRPCSIPQRSTWLESSARVVGRRDCRATARRQASSRVTPRI